MMREHGLDSHTIVAEADDYKGKTDTRRRMGDGGALPAWPE
ncbi:hypothetical protein OK016_13025 [Vibrio chagasii]|nr:hypothetical protein [Vibrio chagasii]